MDENKVMGTPDVPENEEVIENNEEVVAAEVTEEISEEVTEEVAEAIEEGVLVDNLGEEPNEEIIYDTSEVLEAPEKSKKGLIAIIAVIALVVLLVLLIVGIFSGNKYNKMGYENITGITLGEMCEQMGADVEEFKATYELPEDMPADTNFNAAYNMMPVKVIAALNYTDFATLKEEFHLPEKTTPAKGLWGKIKALFKGERVVEITEDTPWGVVQGEVSLQYAVGEENIEAFKEEYGFGPKITLETLWKEVRPTVEKEALKDRLEAEKEAEELEEKQAEDEQNAAEGDTTEGEEGVTEPSETENAQAE